MKTIRFSLVLALFLNELSAFSSSNIQYLYGKFDDNSLFDTKDGGESTLTLEHYRTFDYGDIFAFADYVIADDRFLYKV